VKTNAPPRPNKPKTQAALLRQRWPEFYEWKRANRDVFALPLPGKEGTNAGYSGHWRSVKNAKDLFSGQCETLLNHGLLPRPWSAPPPRRVRLTIMMFVPRKMDRDGRLSRCKRVFDFLKNAGYITDDDDEHCEYGIPEQILCGKTPPRVEIGLEVLEA
jgi:hypothetical protein